jgi:hypothetical protein
MTEKDVKKIINELEQDGSTSTIVAGKLIRMDLLQMGIDNWLKQEGSDVAQDYVTIADAAMTHVINVMESSVAGEQLLDELGIPQSERIDFEEIQNFRNSVLDTFQVLATYLRVLEIAKRKNNESRRE